MGSKKENEEKSTKDDKKAPVTTIVKDTEGTEYQLRPLIPNTDVNFHKIYLSCFSRTLDGIMNQKMKLVLWLIRKMTLTNELKYSYREIARLSGISYQTVADTIKTLIEDDFMRRNGKTLMVNPNAVFRGRLDYKTAACNSYNKIQNQPENVAEEEQAEAPGKGQEKKAKTKKEPKKKPEKKQEEEPKKKPWENLEREPLSMKDRSDLEWELREISNEISKLNNWKDNLYAQLYFDGEKDVSGELEKITKDIEKLSDRVKYISRLLFLAEPPEEDGKKDGSTQAETQET